MDFVKIFFMESKSYFFYLLFNLESIGFFGFRIIKILDIIGFLLYFSAKEEFTHIKFLFT